EVLAIEPLHSDERRTSLQRSAEDVDRAAFERPERDDPNDPGMIELRQDVSLAGEADVLGVVGALSSDDFQGDVLVRQRVEGAVNDADAAPADLALDLEAPRDELVAERFHQGLGVRSAPGLGICRSPPTRPEYAGGVGSTRSGSRREHMGAT